MIKLSRSQQILLVVVLAVVTVALVAYAVRSGGTSRPESAGASSPASSSPSTSVEPPVPTMLVIGDSAAAGTGASARRTAWVGRVTTGIGWNVVNRSVQGAGYVARTNGVGSCTRPKCPSFAALLARSKGQQVDVVLVAGGRDDVLVTDDTTAATRALFAAIRKAFPEAKIVALSPSYDTIFTPASAALTADVKAAVTRVGGTYADIGRPLADHAERIAADGTSPNDMGHRAIARAVLNRLRSAEIG